MEKLSDKFMKNMSWDNDYMDISDVRQLIEIVKLETVLNCGCDSTNDIRATKTLIRIAKEHNIEST